jgi:sulfite reductase alpha subunit-like flavoprotein
VKGMAKDVQRTFEEILIAHHGLTDETAQSLLEGMREEKRYQVDNWNYNNYIIDHAT